MVTKYVADYWENKIYKESFDKETNTHIFQGDYGYLKDDIDRPCFNTFEAAKQFLLDFNSKQIKRLQSEIDRLKTDIRKNKKNIRIVEKITKENYWR